MAAASSLQRMLVAPSDSARFTATTFTPVSGSIRSGSAGSRILSSLASTIASR